MAENQGQSLVSGQTRRARADNTVARRRLPAYYIPLPYPNRILSLPAELTSTIFALADNNWIRFMKYKYDIDCHDESDLPRRPNLVFLHVCRQWRSIALSFPKLWATVLHVIPNQLVSLPLLAFYLERSNSQPLDITIRTQNFFWLTDANGNVREMDDQYDNGKQKGALSPWTEDHLNDLLAALLLHAHRWRRFSWTICIGKFDITILSPLQSVNAPLLEVLDVLTHQQWKHHTLIDIFEEEKDDLYMALRGDELDDPEEEIPHISVNRLTSARLDAFTLYVLAPSFADLTVLELRNSHAIQIPRMAYTKIFASAPRLVNVSFMRCWHLDEDWTGEFDGDEDEELVMYAPCLEVLRIFKSDMGMYMWKHLNAPKLKDLVLSDIDLSRVLMWIDGAWDEDFDHDQVRTSFPTLERLVIENCNQDPLEDPQFLLFCRLTSSISQLVLLRDEFTCIFQQMTSLGPHPLIWPNLQVFRLDHTPYSTDRGWGGREDGVEVIPNLLQRRRDAFGTECIVEIGVGDTDVYVHKEPPADFVFLDSLVERGFVRVDPVRETYLDPPLWPPPPGRERPDHVSELWHVDLLGAGSNPWYDGITD